MTYSEDKRAEGRDKYRMKENKKEQKRYVPAVGFAGWSGSGKTTLLVNLIPAIRGMVSGNGKEVFRIAVIKHDAHGISLMPDRDMPETVYRDTEGKDSWKFRKAGADRVVLCGPGDMFLSEDPFIMRRVPIHTHNEEKVLDTAMQMVCDCDLVLVEGFKNSFLPQIGIARKENGKGLTADPGRFLAVVTDDPEIAENCSGADFGHSIPVFDPDQYRELAAFLLRKFV